MFEKHDFCDSQWRGQYWGRDGAIQFAYRNADILALTQVGWVSLYYGAAGNAWVHWKNNKLQVWWLFRFLATFPRAFFSALELSKKVDLLSAEDCAVVAPVLRHGGMTKCALVVLVRGVRVGDEKRDFTSLALIFGELHEMGCAPSERVAHFVWGTPHFPLSLEMAQKTRHPIDLAQLARVLRKVGSQFAGEIARMSGALDQELKAQ